jgi:hypothetical protein
MKSRNAQRQEDPLVKKFCKKLRHLIFREIFVSAGKASPEKCSSASSDDSVIVDKAAKVAVAVTKEGSDDDDESGDEFQDEIHFDPTISSGHLGFRDVSGFLYGNNSAVKGVSHQGDQIGRIFAQKTIFDLGQIYEYYRSSSSIWAIFI